MTQFLVNARTALMLLPLLISGLKALEEAIPGAGKGEQKIAILRITLEAAYSVAQDVSGSFDDLWPAIKKIADGTVAVFNAVGTFKKS